MQAVLLCTSSTSEVAGFGLVGNRYWYRAVTKVCQKFCLLDSFTTTHWYVTGRICFNGKKVRDVGICDRRIAGSVFLLGSFVKLTLKLVLSRLVKARPVNTLGTQWLGQEPNHIRDIVIYGICCEMSSTTEWLGIRKHRKVLIIGQSYLTLSLKFDVKICNTHTVAPNKVDMGKNCCFATGIKRILKQLQGDFSHLNWFDFARVCTIQILH